MMTAAMLLARRSLAGVALVAVVAAGCGNDDDNGAATDSTESANETGADQAAGEAASGDVLEVAASQGDLGTFLAALEAAGTMESLHGEGPFTVFAPTDEAFAAYLEQSGMTQDQVFGDPEALRGLLEFHVVEMNEPSEMVMDMAGQEFTTASGEPLAVSAEGDDIMVGNAMVERYDLEASNGVVHVIDHVLVPPSMAAG
jgi:uncharacterized surface protein with fasciclin (FAS1) repeats